MEKFIIVSANFCQSVFEKGFLQDEKDIQCLSPAKILNKTDEILSGKQIDMTYDETVDSAISERLNRIMEISDMQKEAAEQERDAIKALLSNINHQIRTPLANITLYAGLLKDDLKESSSVQIADKIEKNVGKLDFFMKELKQCHR